jgi:hypothetical protein
VRRIPWDGLVASGLLLFAAWALWWREKEPPTRAYDDRSGWSAPTLTGPLNYSAYTYRDRNRNGVLDLGDRPLASIRVTMTTPRGRRVRRVSNLSGFVNFPMTTSLLAWRTDIRRPGEYTFRADIPPGWDATSGNAEQRSAFAELAGSPTGLISLNPTRPVGLAPKLTITGRIAAQQGVLAPGRASLFADRGAGEQRVALSRDTTFEIPVTPGRWRLIAVDSTNGQREVRQVDVRDVPVRLATIVLGRLRALPAPQRQTLDFESVTGSFVAKIPAGYGGLEWDYLNAIDSVPAKGEGYVNAAVSGRYVGYSSSGHPVTLSRRGGFDFVGGYLGLAWGVAEGETLEVEAWRDGALVGQETIRLSALGPIWFEADYRGVDRVHLKTAHYWQFVVDDLLVGLPQASSR